MTAFLERLGAYAQGRAPVLQPRARARFEPAAGHAADVLFGEVEAENDAGFVINVPAAAGALPQGDPGPRTPVQSHGSRRDAPTRQSVAAPRKPAIHSIGTAALDAVPGGVAWSPPDRTPGPDGDGPVAEADAQVAGQGSLDRPDTATERGPAAKPVTAGPAADDPVRMPVKESGALGTNSRRSARGADAGRGAREENAVEAGSTVQAPDAGPARRRATAERVAQAATVERGVRAATAERVAQAATAERGVPAATAERVVRAATAERGVPAATAERAVQTATAGRVVRAADAGPQAPGEPEQPVRSHRPVHSDRLGVAVPSTMELARDHVVPALAEAGLLTPGARTEVVADPPGARPPRGPRPGVDVVSFRDDRTDESGTDRPVAVTVTIGQVNVVRAAPAAASRPDRPARAPGPDHEAYLRRRREDRR